MAAVRQVVGAPDPGARASGRIEIQSLPLGLRTGVLGKKWTFLILREVAHRAEPSFGQLLRIHPQLGRRVLSRRLEELRREGYLVRCVLRDTPRRTTYRLTEKGADAIPVLYAFAHLVRRYGEGVAVSRGRERPVQELCFAHPDVPKDSRDAGRRSSRNESSMPTRSTAAPKVLLYKDRCERCGRRLEPSGEAYVCSHACTWCRSCAAGFLWRCPNCEGELRQRIPRVERAASAEGLPVGR